MSRDEQFQPAAARVEQGAGANHGADQSIPSVCFLDDIARILRMARRTIEKLRRHGAFPIRELPALDKRPRWSGAEVQRFLDGQGQVGNRSWRRRA